MLDLFAAAKMGRANTIAFTASVQLFQLVPLLPGKKMLFALFPTEDCYILQGASTLVVSSTVGMFLLADQYYPLAIEASFEDSYISVVRSTTSGNLIISCISEPAIVTSANVPNWTLRGPI